jgi:predicted metal-binding protein
MNKDFDRLIQLAISLGASEAHILSSDEIVVKDQLARKCIEPQCENYGLSYSCPPHVEGPESFRELIKTHPRALVIRLVIPSLMLLSWERLDLGRILHELVATVELEARKMGYTRSSGFAGGSCKELFCQNHLSCQRIKENGPCRHSDLARPSMSGYGIDVFQLVKSCSWDTNLNQDDGLPTEDQLSWVAGLVMIGE